jgi:hypothetical protein
MNGRKKHRALTGGGGSSAHFQKYFRVRYVYGQRGRASFLDFYFFLESATYRLQRPVERTTPAASTIKIPFRISPLRKGL